MLGFKPGLARRRRRRASWRRLIVSWSRNPHSIAVMVLPKVERVCRSGFVESSGYLRARPFPSVISCHRDEDSSSTVLVFIAGFFPLCKTLSAHCV